MNRPTSKSLYRKCMDSLFDMVIGAILGMLHTFGVDWSDSSVILRHAAVLMILLISLAFIPLILRQIRGIRDRIRDSGRIRDSLP